MKSSDIPPAMEEELLTRQCVALSLANTGPYQIAKQLGVSRSVIQRIIASPKYRELMAEIGEVSLNKAVMEVKNSMARLASKAVAVVETHLNEGSLEGAKVVFKILGVDQQEEKAQDSVINVILPGKTEEVIEVKQDGSKS